MFLKGNDFLKNVFTFQSSVTAQFTMFLFNIIHLHLIIMYFCSNINSNFAYFHVEGYFLFDYMMLWWGEFCKFCLETGKQRKTKFRFWNHVHFFVCFGLTVSLRLLQYDEEYVFGLPSAYARSILTVPWVELGDKVSLVCEKTNLTASIIFHTRVRGFMWCALRVYAHVCLCVHTYAFLLYLIS